jgi:uncharacterized phage infection (PIP) family protein YhgE
MSFSSSSIMSSAESIKIQLGPTYGAELLAAFVSVALWGMTCMQTVIYFIQYPKDDVLLKALVVWLWLVNTAHEILIVKGVYDVLIVFFGNYIILEIVVSEFLWALLLTVHLSHTPSPFMFTSA